ncbi:MAG: hypothetical protein A2Y73_05425 [Chloroflexi bacterium RBG_13_56_8]|nr:MAG: hypothetical protein A2Y73_05425 [Chloroflexi bacterium RBG_13_56_8]
MAMSKGQEHLQEAVGIIQNMLNSLVEADAEVEQVSDVQARLEGVLATLHGVSDTFFLQSNLCLYFTKQLLNAAQTTKRALDSALAGDDAANASLQRALPRLTKAAQTLGDKSQMRDGVTLT